MHMYSGLILAEERPCEWLVLYILLRLWMDEKLTIQRYYLSCVFSALKKW